MTSCPFGSRLSSPKMPALSSSSAFAFSGERMSTSGSTIGTRPAATIWRANSNCWVTMSSMPARFAYLMHERKHLLVVGPRAFLDAVGAQRSRRASSALIQRRDEPRALLHLLELLFEIARAHRDAPLFFR